MLAALEDLGTVGAGRHHGPVQAGVCGRRRGTAPTSYAASTPAVLSTA